MTNKRTANDWAKRLRTAALVLAGAVMACSPMAADAGSKGKSSASATAAKVHPLSGLPVIPLTVASTGGKHAFAVEVAKSSAEQAQGLMFRTAMGADEGMIFIRQPPDVSSFWMRNTVIPLDIIFIGTDRRILNIAADARPYDETPRPSFGIAAAVLELNGGRAAQLGIKPGDKVEW
jgi:uncharacterized membrane protein (UPF0127 family)